MENVNGQIWNEDCVTGMRDRLAENSIDLTVTSIPFESLFVYSNKLEDIGNNGTSLNLREGRFALNLMFWIDSLFRVQKPGTNACIHIQQLLRYKNQHDAIGRRDFRGAVIDMFMAGGWVFFGEVAIAKNPQIIAQRLKLHSLQFKTGHSRNSCNLAPAPNDYVLIFQKPGEAETPVRALHHPHHNPGGWLTSEDWIQWACGVWADINETDVLDNARQARESDEEKHVCPLQLEVIRRLVLLYSNPATIQPDVTVLDPFMGVGSTAFEAIANGRNAVGFELKDSYYATALKNIEQAKHRQPDGDETLPLFNMEAA